MATDTKVEYTLLDKDQRLAIAREQLLALESEHYRLSLALRGQPTNQLEEERRDNLAERIKQLQQEVAALEKE